MKRINLRNLTFNIFFTFLIISIIGNFVKYRLESTKLKRVEMDNIKLTEQIEKLKKDINFAKSSEFVEKIAREKFDMIKDGELIIILERK